MKYSPLFVSLAISVLLIAGCSEAPTELNTNAEQTLSLAQTAEAELYAPTDYTAARDALVAARAELASQQEKFSLFRSYDLAEQKLFEADSLARVAKDSAERNREALRAEIENLVLSAQMLLDSTQKHLDIAPVGKGNRIDITLMRHELTIAAEQMNEIQRDYDEGRLILAKSKIEAVLSSIDSVRMQLSGSNVQFTM